MGLRQDLVYPIARRWIAGKDLSAGLAAAADANRRGLSALLNYLGEDLTEPGVAEEQTNEYLALQKAISDATADASVSVKLTQLGLLFDEALTLERLETLASGASILGQALWVDMEGSKLTDKTLELYLRLLEKHSNVGVALQAYLRRSEKDLSILLDRGAKVRLVKGAYREDRQVAFPSRQQVSENYSRLMRLLFDRGEGFTIATHDSRLIDEARQLSASRGAKFGFAMLRGIRDELKAELVSSGYRVTDYIPYGDQWYPYSVRRMKEHPSNVWLLLRSLF